MWTTGNKIRLDLSFYMRVCRNHARISPQTSIVPPTGLHLENRSDMEAVKTFTQCITDHFSNRCFQLAVIYLFTVSNSGMFLATIGHLSSCWAPVFLVRPRTSSDNFELRTWDKIEKNQRAMHIGHMSFSSKFVVRAHRHTHTHRQIATCGPHKWSATFRHVLIVAKPWQSAMS